MGLSLDCLPTYTVQMINKIRQPHSARPILCRKRDRDWYIYLTQENLNIVHKNINVITTSNLAYTMSFAQGQLLQNMACPEIHGLCKACRVFSKIVQPAFFPQGGLFNHEYDCGKNGLLSS